MVRAMRSVAAACGLVALAWAGLTATGCKARQSVDAQPVWYEAAEATASEKDRVGTVSRTEFLIAYYRCAWREADTRALVEKRDACLARGDKAGAAAVEAEGAASQDLAHDRLAGRAPLAPIVDLIRERLPEVAKEAGVARIQEAGAPVPAGATTVDVTERIGALFPVGSKGPAPKQPPKAK